MHIIDVDGEDEDEKFLKIERVLLNDIKTGTEALKKKKPHLFPKHSDSELIYPPNHLLKL